MTQKTEASIKLCLASPIFYPTYGGSTLRFMRYLPGFRQRNIDCRVLTGTPLAEDAATPENRALWSQYQPGQMLPIERVNDTPLHRVRLPDDRGVQRTTLLNRALLNHCRNLQYKPDVIQLVGNLRLKSVFWLSKLRAMDIPLVYAVTNTSKLIQKSNRSPLCQAIMLRQWRYRTLFNYLDCVIVNNTPMRNLMRDMGVTSRIEVIQNGVNLQRFSVRRRNPEAMTLRHKLGIGDDEMMITTVGAVMPRKGSDLLLEAWTRINAARNNTHLVYVGPRKDLETPGLAAFNERLEQLRAASGNPERVHFVGLADNVESYLNGSDVFVLPSRREGMPNSVIEAMACGTPVVITPFVGLSDDLGTAGKQYLLADFAADSLAATMAALLKDHSLRATLGKQGRTWIETTMDMQHSLDRYAGLYRELAENTAA
jgi:glycosyltransferase involved in cell wall biosynthesis